MKGGIKNYGRTFFVPALFTFAAFAFWLKYSPGENYWWIILIVLIFAGHFYYYLRQN